MIISYPGSESDEDEVYYARNFRTILQDAYLMLQLSSDDPAMGSDCVLGTHYEAARRAGIVNACLLIECGANCCISALNLSERLLDGIEKLRPLEKYEFFLRELAVGASFDYGKDQIAKVRELIKARNSYVHPKVSKRNTYRDSNNPDTIIIDGKRGALLKLFEDPVDWDHRDLNNSLAAVLNFFNLFFLDWCGFDHHTTCDILMGHSKAEIPTKSREYHFDKSSFCLEMVSKFGLDLRFMGLACA